MRRLKERVVRRRAQRKKTKGVAKLPSSPIPIERFKNRYDIISGAVNLKPLHFLRTLQFSGISPPRVDREVWDLINRIKIEVLKDKTISPQDQLIAFSHTRWVAKKALAQKNIDAFRVARAMRIQELDKRAEEK